MEIYFGYDWWGSRTTSEIYLNTHRSDWWRACRVLAHHIAGAKSVLDIGGGDGHTLWQILSVAEGLGTKISELSVLEPGEAGLTKTRERLAEFQIPDVRFYRDTFEGSGRRILAERTTAFDVVLCTHANYHFGMSYPHMSGYEALDLLLELGKKLVITTAPRESDYYKVVSKNPFPQSAYAESIKTHYRRKGCVVKIEKTPMRFYVAHAEHAEAEAVLLWKFFYNTADVPTKSKLTRFKKRLRELQDKTGHINFRDEVLIVTK